MSGCNCKSDKKSEFPLNEAKVHKKLGPTILMYLLKSIGFLLMMLALPLINIAIIWFIFKTLMLNEEVDIKPLLYAIGKKFKQNDSDDDEENDYEELTEALK